MENDTRQTEYTELTAVCGHQIRVRLDQSAVAAKPCKTSCVNAKRGDCECSCGGRDHGIYA